MTLVERWATAELATAELATVELQLNYKLNSSLKLRKLYVTYIRIQIILKIKYIVDIVHSTEKHQHPKKYKINSWAEASWHIFAQFLPEVAGVGFPKMNLGRFSNQKRVSNKKKSVFQSKKGFQSVFQSRTTNQERTTLLYDKCAFQHFSIIWLQTQ